MNQTPAIAVSVPDWTSLDREIVCPLCGYNLRGLTEPRCPECGHQSTWAELQAELGKHRWLFEHQRKWGIIAFFKTFYLSQFPRRFWMRLKPTDELHITRLMIYWAVLILLSGAALFTGPLVHAGQMYWKVYEARKAMFDQISAQKNNRNVQMQIARTGSIQAFVDEQRPYPSLRDAMRLARSLPFSGYAFFGSSEPHEVIFAAMVLWPWLTVLSLHVFRQTLRRARIRLGHTLRCAIYAADPCILLAPIMIGAALLVASGTSWDTVRSRMSRGMFYDPFVVLLLAIMIMLLSYRLWISVRKYLRIPHAGATCIACEAMVAMAMLMLYAWFG